MNGNVVFTSIQGSGIFKLSEHGREVPGALSDSQVGGNVVIAGRMPGKILPVHDLYEIEYSEIKYNDGNLIETCDEDYPVKHQETDAIVEHLNFNQKDNITIYPSKNELVHFKDNKSQTVYKIMKPADLGLVHDSQLKHKKKIFPKKVNCKVRPVAAAVTLKPKIDEPPHVKLTRTRSGRLSKSILHIDPEKQSAADSINYRELLTNLQDTDYKGSTNGQPIDDESPVKLERKLPPDSKCPKCGKIFLGKRMQKHFLSHPDHRPTAESTELSNMDLFSFLREKVKCGPENERTEIFLSEINSLVKNLQELSSRLIQNTSGMHFINPQTSKLLGIPEGFYTLDMKALFTANDTTNIEQGVEVEHPTDYNFSNISLNLSSDNMIPHSEESLLKTVDDLVKLGAPHNDSLSLHQFTHSITDNAVEAETIMKQDKHMGGNQSDSTTTSLLDLSIDLFQFKSPMRH